MNRFDRIIFVDTDDTARAPMARAILETMELKFPCEICSRGLVSLFPQPMNQKAEEVLAMNGLATGRHNSSQLVQADITATTLILTMEENQKGKIWEEYESALHVYTLPGYLKLRGEIPALFGEPPQEYGRCFLKLQEYIKNLAIRLNEEVEK